MIVPHLHFFGNCEEAINAYEKAFNTKADNIVRNCDYSPEECKGDNRIAHATMKIHEQIVFLNDNDAMFGIRDLSLNFPVHLIVYFQTKEELLNCYELLKDGNTTDNPFVRTTYSELVGNFKDKFGMLWGFMIFLRILTFFLSQVAILAITCRKICFFVRRLVGKSIIKNDYSSFAVDKKC